MFPTKATQTQYLCGEVGNPGKLLFSLKKNISAEAAWHCAPVLPAVYTF
jgi:hypothetical protein